MEDLDSYIPVEAGLMGLVHLGHATTTYLLDYVVSASERLTNQGATPVKAVAIVPPLIALVNPSKVLRQALYTGMPVLTTL